MPLKRTKASPKTIPPSVISSIGAAALVADIFPVDKDVVVFTGQVLKVNTLVFRPKCKLLLVGNTLPWIAVVARTIKFAAPDEVAQIAIAPDDTGTPPQFHAILPPAKPGRKGGRGENGTAGENGVDGLDGVIGIDGPDVPSLYLVTDSIRTQPDSAPPNFISLTIWNRGRFGSEGGVGQDGQDGGRGGDGGNGVWSSSRLQCITAARSGGPGGNGGAGGNGGPGGRGGNGGVVHFAGSAQAVDLFEFSDVRNLPGAPGLGNTPGANGAPGSGGDRGSRPGQCTGGSRGPNGIASPHAPQRGALGQVGLRGAIQAQILNVASLF